MTARGKPQYSKGNLPQYHFVQHKSYIGSSEAYAVHAVHTKPRNINNERVITEKNDMPIKY
jgi:hypothetical protein